MNEFGKVLNTLTWLPSYAFRFLKQPNAIRPEHLIISLADHFEPCFTGVAGTFLPVTEQVRKVHDWCRRYPEIVDEFRDSDGQVFKHTYFYPAEHPHNEVLSVLAEHCHQGWGEIEIHLHHGLDHPDTPQNTTTTLEAFRETLGNLGCLSVFSGETSLRYAFVHGNWALANSSGGNYCGVDSEIAILAETGCYADFTLPSAPAPSQIRKINSIYECTRPINRRSAHSHGRDLRVGCKPTTLPLIIQGPLMLDFSRRKFSVFPRIDNAEIASWSLPDLHRLRLWCRAGISVQGRPEWCFIKLHCHGMDSSQESAMLGRPFVNFLSAIIASVRKDSACKIHFVTAREMVNMVLAACEGCKGDPGQFRNYRLKLRC